MKKIYAIFGLALAMLTAGCAKDATNDVAVGGKVVLGVGIEDIKHDVDDDPYISCPLCKKTTYIDEREWFDRKTVNVHTTTKPFESN